MGRSLDRNPWMGLVLLAGLGTVGLALPCRAADSSRLILRAAPGATDRSIILVATFDPADLSFRSQDGRWIIASQEGYLAGRPGEPALPSLSARVLLPDGMRAARVTARPLETERRATGRVAALPWPAVLGGPSLAAPPIRTVAPDASIYESAAPFPAELAGEVQTRLIAGKAVAFLDLHPVQYLPQADALLIHTRIEIEIGLAPEPRFDSALFPGVAADPARALLDADPAPIQSGEGAPADPELYAYIVIAPAAWADAYQPLIEWKTRKGVPAGFFAVEEIRTDFPAIDTAASLRAFLQQARAHFGTSFVLLGGDTPWVPTRWAWAMDCEAGFAADENEIHTDLYYSDLDGTWDADGDGIYGEVADSVDLVADLFVGRLPAGDALEAATCVDKILDYERYVPVVNATDVLFCAEVLWSTPYTDSGVGKDMLDDLHFGPHFDPLTKLYESSGNESRASVIAAMNAGPHFVNHCGHAWYNVLAVGNGSLSLSDVDNLVNGTRTFLVYSIGCWSAALDKDAIAERFLTNPDGGAFAYVGNSRYGWGAPGLAGMGYSERFDRDFFGALLSDGVTRLGVALAEAKLRILPYSHDENVYRWHQYQVNLLGDPEMAVHTREPLALAISAPAAIPLGEALATVHVTDASGPVPGARVCIAGLPGVYMIGLTDPLGTVRFSFTASETGELSITATAQDHLCAETPLLISDGSAPLLVHSATQVDDDALGTSQGNGNAEVNPGETVEIRLALRNLGGARAEGITATLATSDPFAVLTDAQESWPDLDADQSAFCLDDFDLVVGPDCPPGRVLAFELTILAEAGAGMRAGWSERIALEVVAGGPAWRRLRIQEVSGDGDGMAEPGERVLVMIEVENQGGGTLASASGELSCADDCISILQSSAALETPLAPGASGHLTPPFEIEISPGCAAPQGLPLALDVQNADGAWDLAGTLVIGETGIREEFEGSAAGWTHSGTQDLWHISTHRAHSGSASWYCGQEAIHQYVNGMNSALVSPWITLPQDASLHFWRYFDVTIYGSDGLFVEIDDGSGWEMLDYLGSGGALDQTAGFLFFSDWAEMIYPLEAYAPGTPVRIRLRMVTDAADCDEGFYIDDVSVGGGEEDAATVPFTPGAAGVALATPNPFRDRGELRFVLPHAGDVQLEVCDIAGRRIETLAEGWRSAGAHSHSWNGRDRAGRPLPTGVYYLRLQTAGQLHVRPFVLLR
ncbi:MAG: C25 family cysteine peptidase [Candidatus Eisenbacteria bacterium]